MTHARINPSLTLVLGVALALSAAACAKSAADSRSPLIRRHHNATREWCLWKSSLISASASGPAGEARYAAINSSSDNSGINRIIGPRRCRFTPHMS